MPTKTVVERLVIEIGGDSAKFKRELRNMQGAQKGFEGSLKTMAVVGKASFLAIGAAAATLGTLATKAFAEFETGLTNVAKTTDLSGQDLDDFKQNIIDLSEEIPVTTQKLLEIATASGQLGIKGVSNLTKFTKVIAELGRTTDVEGEAAALAIARILNLTNESIDSVDKLGSTLVDLGNNFAATESEILEVAKDVAKATVQFKLSSDEILGISAAMASLGIAAEAGGTVVGKAFQGIDKAIRTQAGPAFEKIVELTGLTGDALTKTFAVDSAKVFELFIQGLGKAGAEGRDMTDELQKLGLTGIRVNKILPTLAGRADIFSSSMERAAGRTKNVSALQEESAKAFATTASQLEIAQTKINNTLILLGENIAPQVIQSVELLSDKVRESTGLVNALAGAINGLLFVVRGSVEIFDNFFSTFSEGIEKLKTRNLLALIAAPFLFGIKSLDEFGANLDKATKKRIKDEKKLAKQLLTLQKKLNRDRLKELKNAAAISAVETKRSEEATTEIVTDEEQAKLDVIKRANAEKLRLQNSSFLRSQRLNEAEIALKTAQRQKASDDEIQFLQKKFDALTSITRIENEIEKIRNGKKIGALEQQQIDHKTKLLEIEQANFEDLLRTQETGFENLLIQQDDFEEASRESFEDFREDIEQDFKDNPITLATELETPSAEDIEREIESTAASCKAFGRDFNPVTKQCCPAGKTYNPSTKKCEAEATDTGTTGTTGTDTGASDTDVTDFIKGVIDDIGDVLSFNVAGRAPTVSKNLSFTPSSPSVSRSRSGPSGPSAGQQTVVVDLRMRDGLVDFITAKQREKTNLRI